MADDQSDKDESVAEKDPLSFFAAGDSSSSSDSESDNNDDDKGSSLKSSTSIKNTTSPATKLPSPTTLFATVGRPAFLESKEESYVDWNSLSKRYEPNTYSAPPVQSSVAESRDSEEYEDAVISSAPVKYGKEMSDIQKHLVVHDKRSVKVALNILNDRGELPH